MKEKQRLDTYLYLNNLVESRSLAKSVIMAGLVCVDDRIITKPGYLISSQEVKVKPFDKYVSRGALKLQKALDLFNINVKNKVSIDIGAGSGGFSEIILERGAKLVVAIDVGYGQYSWKLRNNPRVKLLERTNVRYLDPEVIGVKADLAVIDLSFISVLKVINNIKKMLVESADIIILIKPQFEAGKGNVPKGGVIKEADKHLKILSDFIDGLRNDGIYMVGLLYSPIVGAKGNIEFLGHFTLNDRQVEINISDIVRQGHEELINLRDIPSGKECQDGVSPIKNEN